VSRTLYPRFATVGLLLLAFALILTSAVQKSPTMDEQNHIARGAAYLGTGDPRLSIEHPPLVNVLSALPVHLLLHPHLPLDMWWEASEWYHFSENFLWKANSNPDLIVFLARLPIHALALILISLVFRWGNELFGEWGGTLAATFCALDPNVLAHARLSTTDLGGTVFVFLATYSLWHALRKPSWARAVWAGLALGLALSAKLSAILFGPILVLLVLVDTLTGHSTRRQAIFTAGRIALVGFLGGLVVWAVYSFQIGPLGANGPIVPAAPFVRGVFAILRSSAKGRPAYLLGQCSEQGWWYYFPVAFAVKTPLATVAALILASASMQRRWRRDDFFIVVPPTVYFVISMTSNINIGYRHLVPMLPFLALHIGRLATSKATIFRWHDASRSIWRNRCFRHSTALISGILAVALALSTFVICPDFLAFFNVIGGGPDNGWRILVDSNIDWGQDLKALHKWMAKTGTDEVRLSWFGTAYPEAYGIKYKLLPGLPYGFTEWESPPFDRQNPESGTYVISVTDLVGAPFPDHDLYGWFRAREPSTKIGYSLFVYQVPDNE